jgi:predicted nucleic acid-binding protein
LAKVRIIDGTGSRRALPGGLPVNVGLDTSVVVRLLVGLPENEYRIARKRLDGAFLANDIVLISDIVLAEAYHALCYHYEIPEMEARRRLAAFVESGLVLLEPTGGVRALRTASGAGLMDRMIHERYRSLDAVTLTFDGKQGRLEGADRLR